MATVLEKQRKKRYSRERQDDVSEIGPPEITDEHRQIGDDLRNECREDLECFNVKVFPNSTGLKPFGKVQIDSIAHDQAVIIDGGRECKAEPRGFGKTSRGCNAAMWGVLYEYRRMVPVFSANMEKSKNQIMARWKTELLSNDFLFWMFPELIWPFRCLENKPQRCASQMYLGELTRTQWTADRVVFPHIPGQSGSGSALIALPLKSCRGATHTTPDGTILRPDLVMFDDVQKDEDADNPNTIRKTEDLIDHTALMLGGHAQSMSAIMNNTVRQPDDLSEVYLKKSGWRRVRYKMLTKRADKEKELWLGKYADLRRHYDPESPDDQRRAHKESLAFYLEHREEMDAGAEVTWDWAYAWNDSDPVEVSARQHAYNILIDLGESVFASECQNEPVRDTGGLVVLKPEEIRKKQSGYERGKFPPEATTLTAMVDVHPGILYWHVWAFEPGFTSYMVDDETFPRQRRRMFSHSHLPITLGKLYPGYDLPATVFSALDMLIHGGEVKIGKQTHTEPGLMKREFIRSDGVPMKINRCGIDASGELSDIIKKFIRQSPFSASLTPTFGRGITARQAPISLWTQSKNSGDGPEWVLTKGKPGDPAGVMFDTNYWKTSMHRALALPRGSQGAAYVYKVDDSDHHWRFSEACNSERPKENTCGSRIIFEFGEPRPGTFNHDWDCAVGCRVMASKSGITSVKKGPKKQRLSLAEYARRSRAG